MKKTSFYEKLKIEREKLNKLVDETLEKGIPLIQDEAFMEQNRKVDELVVKIQKEQVKKEKTSGSDKSNSPIEFHYKTQFLIGGE